MAEMYELRLTLDEISVVSYVAYDTVKASAKIVPDGTKDLFPDCIG